MQDTAAEKAGLGKLGLIADADRRPQFIQSLLELRTSAQPLCAVCNKAWFHDPPRLRITLVEQNVEPTLDYPTLWDVESNINRTKFNACFAQ